MIVKILLIMMMPIFCYNGGRAHYKMLLGVKISKISNMTPLQLSSNEYSTEMLLMIVKRLVDALLSLENTFIKEKHETFSAKGACLWQNNPFPVYIYLHFHKHLHPKMQTPFKGDSTTTSLFRTITMHRQKGSASPQANVN